MLKLFYQHIPILGTWYSRFHVVNLMYLLHFGVAQMMYGTFSGSTDGAVHHAKSPNYPNYVVSLHRIMDKPSTFVDDSLKSHVV